MNTRTIAVIALVIAVILLLVWLLQMSWIRRAAMFCVGVYLLIYSLTVDAVQLGILIASLLLMGVITWDQIAASFGRDGHDSTDQHHAEDRSDHTGDDHRQLPQT